MQSQYIDCIVLRTAVSINDRYYQEEDQPVLTGVYNRSVQQPVAGFGSFVLTCVHVLESRDTRESRNATTKPPKPASFPYSPGGYNREQTLLKEVPQGWRQQVALDTAMG